jgi:hypothetical protein
MNKQRRTMKRSRILAVGVLASIIAAGCGDDDSADPAATAAPTSVAATTAAASNTTAAPTPTEASTTVATTAAPTTVPYETVELKVGTTIASSSVVPIYIAVTNGFFEKQGLEVQLDQLQAPALQTALASGELDMAPQSLAGAAKQIQAGLEGTCVSGLNRRSNFALVAPADSDVPVTGADGATWEDTISALVGSNISAFGPGTGVDSVMKVYFEEAGHRADDFTNIAIQSGAPQVAALVSGQVLAVMTDYATAAAMEEQGGKIVLDLGAEGPRTPLWT